MPFIAQEGADLWRQRIRADDWLRFGRLCAGLRPREPSARITPGRFVCELTGADVAPARTGPPANLSGDDAIEGTRELPQERLDFRT